MKDYLENNGKFSPDPDTETRTMLDALGPETFEAVCRAFGGLDISVPRQEYLSDEHVLVKRLGWEMERELCGNFPGEGLYIPKRDPGIHERYAYITEAVMTGVQRNEIATTLNLSTSYVRRLVKKLGLSGVVADKKSVEVAPSAPAPVSNAGLPCLPRISSPIPHPTNKSRVGGP